MLRFKLNPNHKGIKTELDMLYAYMAESGDDTKVEAARAFLANNPEYVKELRAERISVQRPEK